ncbi:uncharacterized protein EI90DRAFT_3120716 [Cantharellus anzutake]|uniref:uncharacterized protein n=1 Tax=Cantharellus anzutake TaxID=1750568 RepID=UPI00190595BD|nr:uncharacterized protein EI90DRAFT_3120716 [Cantharellus anzutake]KAF8334900.1 hypothetical protein EI90DRAFT_3120716 [Cantharellus anzutake]
MAVINILFQCEILDDDRILRGHTALQELQQLTQGELVPATLIARSEDLREKMRSKQASNGHKSWSFSKFHILLHHSFSSFTAKGVPANSSTKPNEKEHKFFRDTFHAGNFKNTAKRVTIQTQQVQILDLIRQDIEHSTTSTSDPSTVALEGPINSASEAQSPSANRPRTLKAVACSIFFIEQSHLDEPVYLGLTLKF